MKTFKNDWAAGMDSGITHCAEEKIGKILETLSGEAGNMGAVGVGDALDTAIAVACYNADSPEEFLSYVEYMTHELSALEKALRRHCRADEQPASADMVAVMAHLLRRCFDIVHDAARGAQSQQEAAVFGLAGQALMPSWYTRRPPGCNARATPILPITRLNVSHYAISCSADGSLTYPGYENRCIRCFSLGRL